MKDKLIIAAGFIFLIAVVATCNTCWVRPDVETRTDTVYIHVKDSTNWYRPKVTVIQGGSIPYVRVDSFTAYEKGETVYEKGETVYEKGETVYEKGETRYVPVNVDTAAILADYYARVYYSDTANTKYGNVIIQDTVTQNRIAARRVLTDFKFPEVTKAITPKRKQWSIGPQVGYGANQKPYIGIGITYSLIKF
jgi:hypothetical protein